MNQIPNIEETKKAIEQVLLNRIKHIGDEDQLYTGYPAQLIEELAQTFHHQLQKAREENKKVLENVLSILNQGFPMTAITALEQEIKRYHSELDQDKTNGF